jgi:hypothetical protein
LAPASSPPVWVVAGPGMGWITRLCSVLPAAPAAAWLPDGRRGRHRPPGRNVCPVGGPKRAFSVGWPARRAVVHSHRLAINPWEPFRLSNTRGQSFHCPGRRIGPI